ncbi:hypothetical protein ACFORL_03080 [Legionella dresdenensis]|uniref:Uncharacterized protein n=1 Tax=Legionella dresdenensis TaxID=450200 RepID=A0ABV8CDN1_9GAMM
MPLNYIYILSKNPVNAKALTDRKQIPLFIKDERMCHFPTAFEGWQTAITTAAEEAEKNCSSSQVYLVYKCVDMRKSRTWSHFYNVDRYFWFQEPEDLSIVEIQPVCIEDKKIVSRSWSYGKVSGELQHKPFSFVPEPKFESPHDIADLERNVKLYILYRTGEERGHIAYLRKFGPFKGYSVAQKKMAAEKLLSAIENPKISFTDEELKILKNGVLGKATTEFENLIKEHAVRHEFSVK